MREGVRLLDLGGYWVERPYFSSLVADTLSKHGVDAWKEALAISDRAVKESEETGYLWVLPEIYLIRGNIYTRKSPPDVENAQKSFQKALSISQRYKMPFFEQRALNSLEKIVS